jgi:hypothetical protein
MTSKDSNIRSTRLVSVAMTEAGTKQTRAESVIVEKVKRRSVFRRLEASVQGAVHHPADCSIANQGPTTEAIGSAVDAANGNREPAPETTAGEDGRESHGRVHDVTIDGDSIVESKASEFSPGKDPNLSVANYASQIGQNWERGVDAFMTIARLCAEASARLPDRRPTASSSTVSRTSKMIELKDGFRLARTGQHCGKPTSSAPNEKTPLRWIRKSAASGESRGITLSRLRF